MKRSCPVGIINFLTPVGKMPYAINCISAGQPETKGGQKRKKSSIHHYDSARKKTPGVLGVKTYNAGSKSKKVANAELTGKCGHYGSLNQKRIISKLNVKRSFFAMNKKNHTEDILVDTEQEDTDNSLPEAENQETREEESSGTDQAQTGNDESLKSGNGGTPESAADINANDQPETEDELIELGKRYKAQEHHSVLKSRWLFGHAINRSGETVYGENTAGRIAEEVGYSKSTVHKIKKFAEKYSEEDLASLLNGPFPLPWRDVSQNLSVSQGDFLRTYLRSGNPEQFRNTVTQFKRTRARRNQTPREPRKTKVELEAENTQLQKRVLELETENARLQKRISELEGQQKPSGKLKPTLADLAKPNEEQLN